MTGVARPCCAARCCLPPPLAFAEAEKRRWSLLWKKPLASHSSARGLRLSRRLSAIQPPLRLRLVPGLLKSNHGMAASSTYNASHTAAQYPLYQERTLVSLDWPQSEESTSPRLRPQPRCCRVVTRRDRQPSAALAGNLSTPTRLRRELRDRMDHSALMDGVRFARSFETLYEQLWQRYCEFASQAQ